MNLYNKSIYPNPFRHRKLKTSKVDYKMFKKYDFKSVLPYNLSEFEKYFDEFGDLKPEARLKRLIRNTIYDIFDLTLEKTKSNFLTKRFIIYMKELELKSFDNYQKNLRYLEIPVQPLVDKAGFKVQLLSSDILLKARKSINKGRTHIYDYPADLFPETINLWEDFAQQALDKFPIRSYDYLLECVYDRYDKIFYQIDEEIIKLTKWNIVTDINGEIAKIVAPNFRLKNLIYGLNTLLKFLRNLVLLLLTIKCTIYILKSILKIVNDLIKEIRKRPTLIPEIRKKIELAIKSAIRNLIENFHTSIKDLLQSDVYFIIKAIVVVNIEDLIGEDSMQDLIKVIDKIKLSINNFSFKRKIRNFKISLLNYRLNFKYRLLQLITNRII